jgi:hypothetical protein
MRQSSTEAILSGRAPSLQRWGRPAWVLRMNGTRPMTAVYLHRRDRSSFWRASIISGQSLESFRDYQGGVMCGFGAPQRVQYRLRPPPQTLISCAPYKKPDPKIAYRALVVHALAAMYDLEVQPEIQVPAPLWIDGCPDCRHFTQMLTVRPCVRCLLDFPDVQSLLVMTDKLLAKRPAELNPLRQTAGEFIQEGMVLACTTETASVLLFLRRALKGGLLVARAEVSGSNPLAPGAMLWRDLVRPDSVRVRTNIAQIVGTAADSE